MIAWLNLMKNYTPYDAGVGKEAWDTWHEDLLKETQQLLETTTEHWFVPQIQSLQALVEIWLKESQR